MALNSQTGTVSFYYFLLDNGHQYCTEFVYIWVWGKVQVGWGIDVGESAVERIKVSWSIVSSKLKCTVCTYCKSVWEYSMSWQQLRLGADFFSHKRFSAAWSPKIPVRWSVSFQVLNSSDWSGGFISSPWATAATRVIRQPKSTLGVARQPSGGGRQAGKASWPLVCGLLANQLALFSFFLFFFTWSKEVMAGGGEKRFLNSHLPACPTFLSLFSDCDNEFSERVCCNFCSSVLPNYGVQLDAHQWSCE